MTTVQTDIPDGMVIHILRAPPTTTAAEKHQLATLTKNQRRYLGRRVCGLCESPLDRAGCGSVYEACPEQSRIKRRERCLADYKPRWNNVVTDSGVNCDA